MSETVQYGIIRGRHRRMAAELVGIKKMRCDVHKKDGTSGLKVIPIEDLVPDPASQLEWTYRDKWARAIAANWDTTACGIIDVTPLDGSGLSPQARHALKVKKDRERRRVATVETFLNRVGAGEPIACLIKKTVEDAGYVVGPSGRRATYIECTGTLESIFKAGQEGLLQRLLAVNDIWKDDPQTNVAHWLGGLALFCLEGFDERITASHRDRLERAVPAKMIRKAVGKVEENGALKGAGSSFPNPVARAICDEVRSASGMRRVVVREAVEDMAVA